MKDQQTSFSDCFNAVEKRNQFAETMMDLLDHDNDVRWAVLNVVFSCPNIVTQI